MTTSADTIVALKAHVDRAAKLRSEAEVAQKVAEAKLAEVDAELKTLGVNPEHAEQELATLDAQITQLASELETAVAREIATYEQILTAARAAGVVR